MGRTRFHELPLAPLLMLLIAGSVTAAPASSQRTLDEVRTAIDRGQWLTAEAKAGEALRIAGSAQNDAVWELRIRRGEALTSLARYSDAQQLLVPELPHRLAQSTIAMRRLLG